MIKLTTNLGVITLQLDAEKAPKTVANFEQYVREGHYDGTIFHRIIKGFMIQGGGFAPGMLQKPTHDAIQNEANNGLKNKAYTVAMARTSAPHSASAQFFINGWTTVSSTLPLKIATAGATAYLVKWSKAAKLSTK